MQNVRIGIVGLGMGALHANHLADGKISGAVLAAVCDSVPEKMDAFPNARHFTDCTEMIRSGAIDSIIVATPHYAHTTLGIASLQAGLHVLVEKPISVHKADCERLLAAHTDERLVFAAMFNQRTDPRYQKIRELMANGDLGEIRRVHWTITDWFRTDAYYASGGWRATWTGEGGGVLLNQCPHNLDLFQWMFGLPERVRGFCQFGRYHEIEVEDDVTAYVEYDNGTTATFITSTGEAPGTNRLEIAAERGRLIVEGGALRFTRNETAMSEWSRTTTERFAAPPTSQIEIPIEGTGGQHLEVLQNFVDAITHGAALIAPAREGIYSVELANAILLSAWENRTIDLPMDATRYEAALQARQEASQFQKKSTSAAPESAADFAKSFR